VDRGAADEKVIAVPSTIRIRRGFTTSANFRQWPSEIEHFFLVVYKSLEGEPRKPGDEGADAARRAIGTGDATVYRPVRDR
jgi:hypothetical protein